MATRKKSPAPKPTGGLLHGPSRKQWDWEAEKSGSPIKTPERRQSIYNGDVVNAGNPGSTIYTCPSNKRAKLIYAALSTKTARGYIELVLKGVSTFVLHTYTADNLSFVAAYEDGIDLEAGDTVTIQSDATAGNVVTASVQVIEEEFSSGYVVPT